LLKTKSLGIRFLRLYLKLPSKGFRRLNHGFVFFASKHRIRKNDGILSADRKGYEGFNKRRNRHEQQGTDSQGVIQSGLKETDDAPGEGA
jgi:hypothetical protein